jgi:hypothetical protein
LEQIILKILLKVRLQFGGSILSRKNLITIESIPFSHFASSELVEGRMLAAA